MTAIIGHRGARNLWPENSLTGFRNAAGLGCNAIEFDVHLSDAGELLVIHDPTLDRTTDRIGEVRALTPKERRAARLEGSGDCVPVLDEVLEILAPSGMALHVELKLDARGRPYPGLAAPAADRLRAHGVAGRAHLTSFHAGVLRDCREAAPEIARLVSADADRVARQGGIDAFLGAMRELVDIVALRHDFLVPNWEKVAALWPQERLCAWTVNDAPLMREWLARRGPSDDRPPRHRAGRADGNGRDRRLNVLRPA